MKKQVGEEKKGDDSLFAVVLTKRQNFFINQKRGPMKRLFFLFIALFLLINLANAEAQLKSGIILPQAKNLQPFTLQQRAKTPDKKTDQSFTNDNLKNRWTLIFFGFTNCPALCPTTMAQLANAYQQWQTNNAQPMPQVVFVSVDPERDTIEKVNTFATTFNPNFIGLRTDDMQTLAQMTHEMNAMFEKVNVPAHVTGDKDKKSSYTINHTGDIMVINPKGQFVAMLTMPHEAEDIAADYQTIVKSVS